MNNIPAPSPTGDAENPHASLGNLHMDDVREACETVGKSTDDFYEELLPALAETVKQIEEVIRNDREENADFRAEDILRIERGIIFVRVFTCVKGHCNVEAETMLAMAVRELMHTKMWKNIEFDFDRDA